MLCCFILMVSYYNTYSSTSNTIEPFNSSKQHIVLLGDSILKNNAYTSNGKSVEDLLKERTTNNIHCFAVDDSKINDVYNQISNLPTDLNTSHTTVFLSVGGNNILSHYLKDHGNNRDYSILSNFLTSYEHLVQSIRMKLNKAKIILLDVYYPDNHKYKKYHNVIQEWNLKIYDFASNPKNNIDGILRISSIMTKPGDFSEEIEPSNSGGDKLVNAILNY